MIVTSLNWLWKKIKNLAPESEIVGKKFRTFEEIKILYNINSNISDFNCLHANKARNATVSRPLLLWTLPSVGCQRHYRLGTANRLLLLVSHNRGDATFFSYIVITQTHWWPYNVGPTSMYWCTGSLTNGNFLCLGLKPTHSQPRLLRTFISLVP